MKLFNKLRERFRIKKAFKASVNEFKEKERLSLNYSTAELSALTDNDLFLATWFRTEHIVDSHTHREDGINALNASQKAFYFVYLLDMEVTNGGLCQFFTNCGKTVVNEISGCLEIIGADDHKELYDGFIKKTGIDLTSPELYDDCESAEFEQKHPEFSFEEYDNAFFDLEDLETYLTKYVREHIEDF